jgi:hypothetical protein
VPTLPDFEKAILEQMNHQAQDLENTRIAQGKTNVKGEIEKLNFKLESGDLQIPVDNLLPGNLGAEMDIAAGGAVISAGARMDDSGIELTDTTGGELQFPSTSAGDWFTNKAASTSPQVHSGLGFYNDNAADARGILLRASGASSGTRLGRIHLAADNGNQQIAGANTTAELRMSSTNSGIAFAEFFNELRVFTGAFIVNDQAAHFHQGANVNNALLTANSGATVNGTIGRFNAGADVYNALIVQSGGAEIKQGLTITTGNGSWGLAVQGGTFFADNASIHQSGIQVNGALADINAGANIAGGLTVTGGNTLSGGVTINGQFTNNNGAIFNGGFESQGARSFIDNGLTLRGSDFLIQTPGTLTPTVTTTSSTLTAGSAATASHGFGAVPRYVIAQVKESASSVWKPVAEGIAPGPSQFSVGVDSTTVYFNNNESTTVNFRVQYFE